MDKPCECPKAGACPRYGRVMHPVHHGLCQRSADYRKHFSEVWKPNGQTPQDRSQCVHRAPVPSDRRGRLCLLCWVFPCDVHGSCTIDDPTAGVKVCTGCKEFSPDAIVPDGATG